MLKDKISGKIVFIIGYSRSGTTYLQRLLATHHKVKTGQETHIFPFYIEPLISSWKKQVSQLENNFSGRGGLGLPCYINDEQFKIAVRNFVYEVLNPLFDKESVESIIIEKSPSHIRYIETIREVFPNSYIIHIVRHPIDVITSVTTASQSWGKNWASNNVRHLTKSWYKTVSEARKMLDQVDSNFYYEIKYENLKNDTHKELNQIGNFLGINWNQEELSSAIKSNSLKIKQKEETAIPLWGLAGQKQEYVIEPSGFASFDQKKRKLNFFEKVYIWVYAKKLIKELGYEKDFFRK